MSILKNKQLKILNEKSDQILPQKYTKDIINPNYQKEQNINQAINEAINKSNNPPNSPNKSQNEISSKIPKSSKNPPKFKDIFNNKDELNLYLKNNCPEFLEKFELVDFLKSGSAGSVIKAHPKIRGNRVPSNKLIVLKFLYNGKNKKGVQDHSEISIHGALKSKNFPAIYGYYKIGDNSCIAMEMCFYGDIENFKKNVIKRVPLSETLICYIFGGLVDAVYYLHTHNKIIHMDIKQQNVLVDDYLNIKLTDFSVSLCYKNLKKIELPMVGTCYYMSPEVLRKETINACYASCIDVYSIGVLLYLLSFCDYPYKLREVDNKNYGQILKNVETNELEFPKFNDNSKIFIDLLKNCLNKDIKKRYNIYQLRNHPFYHAYQIILNEKEKLYNAGKFVIDLMVDNILNYNEFIKEKEKELEEKNINK